MKTPCSRRPINASTSREPTSVDAAVKGEIPPSARFCAVNQFRAARTSPSKSSMASDSNLETETNRSDSSGDSRFSCRRLVSVLGAIRIAIRSSSVDRPETRPTRSKASNESPDSTFFASLRLSTVSIPSRLFIADRCVFENSRSMESMIANVSPYGNLPVAIWRQPTIAANSSSLSTITPKLSAFVSFEPASSPATT